MSQEDDLEQLMSHIGDFGKYQFYQFLLHLLAAFTAGLHMLTLVTVAAVPKHRCFVLDIDGNSTSVSWNSSVLSGWVPFDEISGALSSCSLKGLNESSNSSYYLCNDWVYDDTYYQTTRSTEWDFVCSRRWMGALSQASYMFGVFAGSLTLGSMADKYGRKTIFYISAVMQLIFGTVIAFVTNFQLFLAMSFFYGVFGSAGAYITAFVLSMEIIGPSKRTICGMSFSVAFAFGIMAVAVWGYFIRGHVTLQLIYGLHSLLLIGHWWLIDESPRWLWSVGRTKESVKIVSAAAKMNKLPPVDEAHFISRGISKSYQNSEKGNSSPSILDLFRTPYLRTKTLNISLNWFANSLVYYGLSLNTGSLEGNPYFILFLMALVEIPSYILTIILLQKTGRRPLTCMFMIIGSLACLCTTIIPQDNHTLVNLVVFFGKFCISSSFAIMYNYSAELFPTVVRNTGMGVGSMCARFSATLTPLITLLDSFDKRIPTVLFAAVALTSGMLTMFLPETAGQPMPQSLEDGEKFGRGDTCFSRRRVKMPKNDLDDEVEKMFEKAPKLELLPAGSKLN